MIDATAVRAVNTMTARWARAAVADEGTAFAATGVWPLLALLAGGADGPARQELAGALGVGADGATALGGRLLGSLDAMDGVHAATGLWTRQDLPIRPEWEAGLPPGVRSTLTGDAERDRKELDGWASRRTRGAIAEMPVPLTPDTRLVLAGALTVETAWLQPFRPGWLRRRAAPGGTARWPDSPGPRTTSTGCCGSSPTPRPVRSPSRASRVTTGWMRTWSSEPRTPWAARCWRPGSARWPGSTRGCRARRCRWARPGPGSG
ncbi:serpin family protein [Streptomyces indonesiensis]